MVGGFVRGVPRRLHEAPAGNAWLKANRRPRWKCLWLEKCLRRAHQLPRRAKVHWQGERASRGLWLLMICEHTERLSCPPHFGGPQLNPTGINARAKTFAESKKVLYFWPRWGVGSHTALWKNARYGLSFWPLSLHGLVRFFFFFPSACARNRTLKLLFHGKDEVIFNRYQNYMVSCVSFL